MATETIVWINTVVLIFAAIVHVSLLVYLGTMIHQGRREAEAHAERLAAMLEVISRRN